MGQDKSIAAAGKTIKPFVLILSYPVYLVK